MLETLLAREKVTALAPEEARIAHGLRTWVALRRAGKCPMQALAGRLGSLRAAAHLQLLLEEIAACWPDQFAVSPPCCACLSHDEATLVEMARLGRAGDRPGFDRLLGEMLPQDARERLFLSAVSVARAIGEARSARA
ncbi:MAG: hypothetical protein ACK4K7_01625 [Allosphingosinicella sp.]|uniref:hypothetical protein n=1 Tax=Allosphingosinicella sp. TaxID=2823234 RepID=UPI0039571903